jgi:hypothetical protein
MTAHCSVTEVSHTSRSVPFRLAVVLHHGEHARRAAGRRRHVESVGREARDDAVVVDEPVLAQQDPVARSGRREPEKSLT